jgi:hypothetical protein
MSNLNGFLFLFLISAFVIEIVYRKMTKSRPQIDVTKYVNREAGAIYSEYREKYLAEFKRNRLLAYFVTLSFIVYLETKLPGYLYLMLVSVLVIQAFYRSEKLKVDQEHEFEVRIGEGKTPKTIRKGDELRHSRNVVLVIALVVCFGWFVQIERNAIEYRESFLKKLIEMDKEKWCQTDEYKIDSYGDPYYAGWPCIKIYKIRDVRFQESGFRTEACVNIDFDIESGAPGQNEYSHPLGHYGSYCISDNRGFSIYDLEEAISEDLEIELKALQVRLCEKYIGFLNSEDYFVYCSKK